MPLVDPTPQAARELGFDRPVYHGMLGDLQGDILRSGDFGVHVGQPHQAANRIQQTAGDRGLPLISAPGNFTAEGAQVLPLQMRAGRTFRTGDPGNWQILNDAVDELSRGAFEDTGERLSPGVLEELRDIAGRESPARREFSRNWRKARGDKTFTLQDWAEADRAWLADEGYREFADEFGSVLQDAGVDTVVYRNTVESPTTGSGVIDYRRAPLVRELYRRADEKLPAAMQRDMGDPAPLARYHRSKALFDKTKAMAPRESNDSYLVLRPENLRSRWADFDPALSGEAGLFKTLTGAGLLAPWLLEDDAEL